MAEWTGVIKTTAKKYLKGAIDGTVRRRILFKLLEEKGRIQMNRDGGWDQTWDIEYKQPPVNPYGDGGVISFSRYDVYKQANIGVRGYKATDLMTQKEYLMNAGAVQIINRYAKIIPNLLKAMTNRFGGEFYIDGNAAGNENRLHGMDSFLGNDGATVAADRVARPSDTYAGLSTAPGAEGSWSTDLATSPNATIAADWPFGQGDTEYDYMSPKLLNWSSTGWGTGSTSWEDNCEIVLLHAKNFLTHTGGDEGAPDIFLLATDLFTQFQQRQLAKTGIWVPHKKAQDLGFEDALNFCGVMVTSDYDVPSGEGRFLNIDQMLLESIDSVLFSTSGPTFDERTDEYLFKVGYFGNMKYYPKYFGETDNYA